MGMKYRFKIGTLMIAMIVGIVSTMGSDIVAAVPWLFLDLIR